MIKISVCGAIWTLLVTFFLFIRYSWTDAAQIYFKNKLGSDFDPEIVYYDIDCITGPFSDTAAANALIRDIEAECDEDCMK